MKKNRKFKIAVFVIIAAIIIILDFVLLNMLKGPQIFYSPELGPPPVLENFTMFTFVIFGSIGISLIVLFMLFWFFIIKS